jgi:glycosyltransferase involved in cell wall biosynthesis
MHQMDRSIAGVFVGSGSLVEPVCKHAAELGLGTVTRNLGWRDDIAEIMCCCDWFILPSPEQPMEGFGLVVVEAQLAGLRMLLSGGIPDDALLPMAVFRRLPLAAGPYEWAKAALELSRSPAPSRTDALAALNESPMDMDRALEGLLALHA